jgi:hypothetical protein
VTFEDAKNLVTGDETDLRNSMRVAEGDTDLGGSKTLSGELDDVINHVLWSRLQPSRRCPAIREGRRGCRRDIQ